MSELIAVPKHKVDSLAEKLKTAQSEIEALREKEDSLWETFVKVADFLGIDCEKSRKIPGKPSAVFHAAILRKQAEAVEEAIVYALRTVGNVDPFEVDIHRFANDYAQRLRQQADEAERAGGEK